MKVDVKTQIDKFSGGFIKTTDSPVSTLTSEQKAILNRKGNILFNKGEILNAQRLFITTGYSDGLTRVGDYYFDKGEEIKALRLYWLAKNKRNSERIFEKIANIISTLLLNKD